MTQSLLLVHRRDACRQLLGLDAADPDDPDPEPDDEEEPPDPDPEPDDPEPPDGAVVVLDPLPLDSFEPPESFEPPDSLDPPPDSFEPPPEPPLDPLRLSVR
jgi:hypothetical protein